MSVLILVVTIVLYGLSAIVGFWLLFVLYENDGLLAAVLTFFCGFPALFYVFRNWSIYQNPFLANVVLFVLMLGFNASTGGLSGIGVGPNGPNSFTFPMEESNQAKQQPVQQKPRYWADRVGYHNYCADCHGESSQVNAPAIRDTEEWKSRLNERGLDQVMLNAYQGFRGHPRLGGCTMCTSEQVDNMTYHILTESGVEVAQP